MKKIIDVLNVENWKTENYKNNFIVATENEFEAEKEQTIDFLQTKIDAASRLINIARTIDNKEEFYKQINEIKLLFSEFRTEGNG